MLIYSIIFIWDSKLLTSTKLCKLLKSFTMPKLGKWRLLLISMWTSVICVVWLLLNWLVNITETFKDILNIVFFKWTSLNLWIVSCKELPWLEWSFTNWNIIHKFRTNFFAVRIDSLSLIISQVSVCPQGGEHGGGVHWGYTWWGVAGGVHGRGMRGWGAYVVGVVCMAGETATVAGGTHPTGMHSCLNLFKCNPLLRFRENFRWRASEAVSVELPVKY